MLDLQLTKKRFIILLELRFEEGSHLFSGVELLNKNRSVLVGTSVNTVEGALCCLRLSSCLLEFLLQSTKLLILRFEIVLDRFELLL